MTELAFFIKIDYDDQKLTPQGKFPCPLCGDSMWGEWSWEQHRRKRHVLCECGRWFMAKGIRRHKKFCKS